MSEEKIIERLNNILKQWQKIIEIEDNEEQEIEKSAYFEEMPFYEIQGLLDLYQKEKKKAETLAKINESVEILKSYELLDDAIYVAALSPNISAEIDTKYVSKDKIREIIEELEDNCERIKKQCKNGTYNLLQDYVENISQINILKQLLKESEMNENN